MNISFYLKLFILSVAGTLGASLVSLYGLVPIPDFDHTTHWPYVFGTVALATFLAFSINCYFLRKNSQQVRSIIKKLGCGDLERRIEMKTLDVFGDLIFNFNQMAERIEQLVNRFQHTETFRSHNLQELSHDLRTPLTSLSTAFETLKTHHEILSTEEKNDFFSMISNDIRYIKDLIEQLILVSTIDGPYYKVASEKINLLSLISKEILFRQAASRNHTWVLLPEVVDSPFILGDSHLITRLFWNAFDNASKYATSCITVRVSAQKDKIEILVMDDGSGLSSEALASFGERCERRLSHHKRPDDFSLGLGSVIMKKIARAHGGQVEMMNIVNSDKIHGACLKVTFKTIKQDQLLG